jgi:hypothetical protein
MRVLAELLPVTLATAIAMAGCAGRKPAATPEIIAKGSRDAMRITGQISGPGAGSASQDFTGWESWTPASKKRFRSAGHGGVWVDIFVAPPGAEAYDTGRAPIPVGFRVAKATYDDKGSFLAVAGMQKMVTGYDPDHGDWYYVVVLRDGRTATMQGPLPSCRGCHEHARTRDYLFGVTN